MKFLKSNKIKSVVLTSVLSLSLLFSGCANKNTSYLQQTNQNEKTQTINNSNSSTESSNKESVPKDAEEVSISRVVDGDTVKVKLKNSSQEVTLRLLLVDTPESVKPGVDPQPYALDASNYAKKLLQQGDTAYLEYDSGNKTDKYGRYLCYLWYYNNEENSWKMFNETMVEKGYARVGYIYSQRKHLDRLYKSQDKAKAKKLNIWSVDNYVTDKGFDTNAYEKNIKVSSNNTTNKNQLSNTSNITSVRVYANGGSSSSSKYHNSPNAHGMKGSIEMTEKEAKSQGYESCKICYK